jgi:hypothetical protein
MNEEQYALEVQKRLKMNDNAKKHPINALQLGIDIGRVIAHTECPDTSSVQSSAIGLLVHLGISSAYIEDPAFLIGLGFGIADRHKEPLDEDALGIMGYTGLHEPWHES